MHILDAILLGVIEGLTEFLPISSTGHLVLTSSLLGIPKSEFLTTFEIAIQLGAVLAVAWIYCATLKKRPELLFFACIGFLPAAAVGAALHTEIKSLLGSTTIVGWSLFIGGIALIILEIWQSRRSKRPQRTLADLTVADALAIGGAQVLALIPGVSRSAATIAGGFFMHFSRQQATVFSFLLSLPTILGATVFDLVTLPTLPSPHEWLLITLGFITAFLCAMMSVRWLLRFITTHTFISFGIYRIIIGLIVIVFI